MSDVALLGIFLATTFLILIVPGPDVLYVMARSLGQGRRAGLLSVIGIGCGVLVHTFLAAFGLSRLFIAVPAAYNFVKYAGVAYLIYLAIRILFTRREKVVAGVGEEMPPRKLIGQAFLTNLLNPKAAFFFVAMLPQFATATGEALFAELLALGLMVVAMSVAVNALYAVLAAHASGWFHRSKRAENVQRWVSAGTLGFIAILAARAVLPGET